MRTRQAKMLDVMISIHVPKTGGTTFLRHLERLFGQDLLLDYQWTNVQLPLETEEQIRASLEGVRCVHGHFPFSKYAHLKLQDTVRVKYVTWLRDPVELVVSAYEYLRNKEPRPDSPVQPWEQAAKDYDLAGFVEKGFACNRQFKQLRTDSLSAFDFIGITEDFARSLRLFRAMFFPAEAFSLDVEPQRVNPRRKDEKYLIDTELRAAIERRNDRDVALYRRARERFADLCAEYSVGE